MAAVCKSIVGMDLDREVFAGINKFYKQRELGAVLAPHSASHQLLLVVLDESAQARAGMLTMGNDALAALQPRDFPTLAHIVRVDCHALEGGYLVASPQHSL